MIGETSTKSSPIERNFDRIETAPGSGGTLTRSLTRSLDYSKEGLAMNATRTCSVDGCERGGYLTRGFCKTHYARFLAHGDPGGAAIKIRRYDGATCKVSECDRKAHSNNVCLMHYKRFRNHGSYELPGPQPVSEYMRERTAIAAPPSERPGLGPCHVWTGTLFPNGYGAVGLRTHHKQVAHRVAYELAHGEIPAGLVIDHLCRNRACVNPEHLEAVTNLENMRRGLGFRLRNGMDNACLHGHEYTPKNTYINPNNDADVRCRECSRIRDRNRRKAA